MAHVHGHDGAYRDAGRLHVDQQERDALLRPVFLAGAYQAEHPVGPVHIGGPDLLAAHHVVVTVTHGARAQPGQIGAGAGLGITLGPPVVGAADARQEALLLRRRTEGVEDGPDVIDSERNQPGGTGFAGLFFEDEALQRGPVAATEFTRPVADGPALCVQQLEVRDVVCFFELEVVHHLVPQVGRQLLRKAPHLRAELLGCGRIGHPDSRIVDARTRSVRFDLGRLDQDRIEFEILLQKSIELDGCHAYRFHHQGVEFLAQLR